MVQQWQSEYTFVMDHGVATFMLLKFYCTLCTQGAAISALMHRCQLYNRIIFWCTNELAGSFHLEKCFMQLLTAACGRFDGHLFEKRCACNYGNLQL